MHQGDEISVSIVVLSGLFPPSTSLCHAIQAASAPDPPTQNFSQPTTAPSATVLSDTTRGATLPQIPIPRPLLVS